MASRCTAMHAIKESRENKDYGKHFGNSSLIVCVTINSCYKRVQRESKLRMGLECKYGQIPLHVSLVDWSFFFLKKKAYWISIK